MWFFVGKECFREKLRTCSQKVAKVGLECTRVEGRSQLRSGWKAWHPPTEASTGEIPLRRTLVGIVSQRYSENLES